jgi:regulator of sigma E protease
VLDRAVIIAAGPATNYLLAFLIFSVIFLFGSPTLTTEVGGLLSGYPAEAAGVLAGDRVVSVDGKGVKCWEEMTEAIHRHTDGEVALAVERAGRTLDIRIKPVVRSAKDIFGHESKMALIGISPSQKIGSERYPFPQCFAMGAKKLVGLTVMTYKAIWAMLTGKLSVKESLTGPIGIFVITGQAARLGLIYILHLMAILSASLAIFNVLPLPVLDGGHLVFLAVEKLRGKPLSLKAQEAVVNAGIAFLVLLTVFIFYNDIMKFGIFDKASRIFRR